MSLQYLEYTVYIQILMYLKWKDMKETHQTNVHTDASLSKFRD